MLSTRQNLMMNKNQMRVERLRTLVVADGGPAEFARKRSQPNADKPIDPTYVSQILNGHRAFGEKAAANMERRAGITPSGYFDLPFPEDSKEECINLKNASDPKAVSKDKERQHQEPYLSSSDQCTINQFDAGGAMGYGLTLSDQPGVIQNWIVSKEWIAKNVKSHTGVENLCIVTGFGPSMQPTFKPGDPLLVDVGIKSVIADGIYFFRIGTEGFIKQLQKIPTNKGIKYIAKSKNPDFDPFEITEEMDFEILGKVVRVWCGTDF